MTSREELAAFVQMLIEESIKRQTELRNERSEGGLAARTALAEIGIICHRILTRYELDTAAKETPKRECRLCEKPIEAMQAYCKGRDGLVHLDCWRAGKTSELQDLAVRSEGEGVSVRDSTEATHSVGNTATSRLLPEQSAPSPVFDESKENQNG